jgi:Icc protein
VKPLTTRIARPGECLHVVQVTDTHLKAQAGGTLLDLDTDYSLRHVIELVGANRSGIDLVLGTGDISDQGSAEAYVRANGYFQQLGAPIMWLAGNHDCADTMASVLGTNGQLASVAESDHWQLVLLNSQIPGEVDGRLGSNQLQHLEQSLAAAQQKGLHSLVCLHHQPLAMGSAWIDEQMIEDADAFLQIIDRFSSVRGVLWGHVHQQLDTQRNAVKFMSTPSSCIQFAPGSEKFKVDSTAPGYRWLELYPDGSIETGVERVEGVKFEVDLESDGYL